MAHLLRMLLILATFNVVHLQFYNTFHTWNNFNYSFANHCTEKGCRHRGIGLRSLQNSRLPKSTQYRSYPSTITRSQCPVGDCQYYYSCQSRSAALPKFCVLDNGFTGICCNDQFSGSSNPTPQQNFGNIRVEEREVRKIIQNIERLEDELLENEITLKRNTKEFSHQNFFGSNKQTFKEMRSAERVLQGFISFSKRAKLSPQDIEFSKFDIRKTNFANTCGASPVCRETKYRLPDGTCNNLVNTAQGKAVSTYTRLLPPDYADGINLPRSARDGSELPNPRTISLSISPEANIENNFYSLMLMQFGQFVDHDLTRTAITRTHNDMQISCCDEKVIFNTRLLHPACFSIPVPPHDNFLRGESQVCINFVRSAPAVNPRCRFGPREQLNQLSSYLDGNNIYGPSDKEARNLREFRGGRLKVSTINGGDFLPLNFNNSNINCQIPKTSNMKCFLGGDIRANEVADLAVLHTVWLREHNRVAHVLSQLNPFWNDETLYQEAKRIVVAEFQHIIYNEMLPLIIGPKTISHFGLQLSSGYSNAYNPAIDASILNEFSTAAYRLHSLVQGRLNLNTPDNRVVGQLQLRNLFSNPEILYHQGMYEMRLAGLTGQAIQGFDNFFSRDVTNHLFQIPGKRFGLDLVALNIQRGRDHGIRSYVQYREICGLSRVNSFEDLKSIFSNPQVADVMSKIYSNVEDVDLFIAGTSERPLPGAIVGPTWACIIGEQFRRIKEGDRFWYENGNMDTSFTPNQLAEIKKVTLARVLCDNSDLDIMQFNAFLMPGPNNPKVDCSNPIHIPFVNLRHWQQS